MKALRCVVEGAVPLLGVCVRACVYVCVCHMPGSLQWFRELINTFDRSVRFNKHSWSSKELKWELIG